MKIKNPRKLCGKTHYNPQTNVILNGKLLRRLAKEGISIGEFKKRFNIK